MADTEELVTGDENEATLSAETPVENKVDSLQTHDPPKDGEPGERKEGSEGKEGGAYEDDDSDAWVTDEDEPTTQEKQEQEELKERDSQEETVSSGKQILESPETSEEPYQSEKSEVSGRPAIPNDMRTKVAPRLPEENYSDKSDVQEEREVPGEPHLPKTTEAVGDTEEDQEAQEERSVPEKPDVSEEQQVAKRETSGEPHLPDKADLTTEQGTPVGWETPGEPHSIEKSEISNEREVPEGLGVEGKGTVTATEISTEDDLVEKSWCDDKAREKTMDENAIRALVN